MENNNSTGRLIFVAMLFLAITASANAYIDGGSSSMLFQMLLASVLGGLFAVKSFWSSLKMRFARQTRNSAKIDVLDA